jgi:hypothetical protein
VAQDKLDKGKVKLKNPCEKKRKEKKRKEKKRKEKLLKLVKKRLRSPGKSLCNTHMQV